MSTRRLVSEDAICRVYEVRDDDGTVIGTDTEYVSPE